MPFRKIAFLTLLAVASLPLAVLAAEPPRDFFSALPKAGFSRAAKDPVAAKLHTNAAVVSVQLVGVDASQVATGRQKLKFNLAPGKTVEALRESAHRNPDGTVVWQGVMTLPGRTRAGNVAASRGATRDPMNSATLVRNGNRITGTLRIKGRLWQIVPLAGGDHAITELDQNRMPPDHPGDYAPVPIIPLSDTSQAQVLVNMTNAKLLPSLPPSNSPRTGKPTPPPPPAPSTATATVRLMVVITDAAAAATADPLGMINLAVAETNQGYANSGIHIHIELAGWYQSSYVESGEFSTDLHRFQNPADGYLDEYHAKRNEIAADLNMLITNTNSSCGIGYLNANANYAFSVVYRGCATGYYSFAHEIGHNQGAHHDRVNGTNISFPYGHGYWAPKRDWRTIMAYNCSGNCPRLNFWSNPYRMYRGVPMGNAKSDNHRVLNLTRTRVAAFR